MTLLWRSLQYVPAHVEKYVGSPRIREADAVILDLQDSVPVEAKTAARDAVAGAAAAIAADGPDVLVRINDRPDLAERDIEASVAAEVRALVVPNVRDVAAVARVERLVTEVEIRKGLTVGATRLLILIESAEGLLQMTSIARASERIAAINLGNEDLALDLGVEPTEEALAVSRQLLVIAAAAAGVTPLGLLASGSDFSDLDAYRALAERSRRMGFCGASCIHPSQIAILNAAFAPTGPEIAWAQRVVDGAAEAEASGRGAFALDGRMIDAPIVARAQGVLARQAALSTRRRGGLR